MNNTENKMTGLQDSIMWLNETAKEGKEFVSEQAPLYAQEYLTYAGFSYGVGLAFSLILSAFFVLVIIILLKKHRKREKLLIWDFSKDSDRDCILFFISVAFSTIISLVSLCFLKGYSCALLRVIVAPRVALLDHVTSLINSQ